jgi:hypothetical protein
MAYEICGLKAKRSIRKIAQAYGVEHGPGLARPVACASSSNTMAAPFGMRG